MSLPFPYSTVLLGLLVCAATAHAETNVQPLECTYELQIWNRTSGSAVQARTVRHAYADLSPEEIDPVSRCTVCKEDQVRVSLPPLAPFFVCARIAQRVTSALGPLVAQGAQIHSVAGYHVILSRGPVDKAGNRTQFSNHSFGTAIDINPEQNGLYDDCATFGPACRLLRGGEWQPGRPGTLEKHGRVVLQMEKEGFLWGGEIAGKQKDFMHFSLTGY